MKFRGEQNGFEEIKRKFTRYFFIIGCWDHGAPVTVSRGCANIGEAIDALFFPVYKGNFFFTTALFKRLILNSNPKLLCSNVPTVYRSVRRECNSCVDYIFNDFFKKIGNINNISVKNRHSKEIFSRQI